MYFFPRSRQAAPVKDELEVSFCEKEEKKKEEEGRKEVRSWKRSEVCSSGEGNCNCRKCSLISLGDVEPREVHSMIRFIKQNKVAIINKPNIGLQYKATQKT